MHVLRSVCPNGSQKHMHLPYLNPHAKWVICLLPAKNKIYRYLTYISVILRSGCTFQYAILHIFVLPLHCNPSRASILTPSYHYMHTNLPCTEITSRNAKYVHIKCIISRLVGPFCMKFRIFLRYSGLKLNLSISPKFQNLPKMVVPP